MRKKSTAAWFIPARGCPLSNLFNIPDASKTATAPIRVLCVDHHAIILAGIAATLKLDARLEIVGLIDGMREAVSEFKRLQPDIVLTEFDMPGFLGVDCIRAFTRVDPSARVMVLTSAARDGHARVAMAAGAVGFLLKSRTVKEIVDSIESAFHGNQVLDPEFAQGMLTNSRDRDDLDTPEIEALRMVANGTRTTEVAQMLRLNVPATRAILFSAVRKLGAVNRTQAVMLAKARGLIDRG